MDFIWSMYSEDSPPHYQIKHNKIYKYIQVSIICQPEEIAVSAASFSKNNPFAYRVREKVQLALFMSFMTRTISAKEESLGKELRHAATNTLGGDG